MGDWIPKDKLVPNMQVHPHLVGRAVVVESDLVDHNQSSVHDDRGWTGSH